MDRVITVAFVSILTALVAAGCGAADCEGPYCETNIQITMSGEQLEDGSWRIEFSERNKQPQTCEFQVPAAPGTRSCGDEVPLEYYIDKSDGRFEGELSRYYSNPQDLPANFSIAVFHDNSKVFGKSYKPNYVTTKPDGDACEKTCREFTTSISTNRIQTSRK
jgi:hypothetical protein